MKTFLISLIVIANISVNAQTRISGKVTDIKGISIPGANVYLKGTYDGTSSDKNGNFLLITDETGSQILVVQAISYKTFESNITCSEQPILSNISLSESINLLTAVTITAGAMEASDLKESGGIEAD